jgi:hypothetical protein
LKPIVDKTNPKEIKKCVCVETVVNKLPNSVARILIKDGLISSDGDTAKFQSFIAKQTHDNQLGIAATQIIKMRAAREAVLGLIKSLVICEARKQ